VVHVVQAGDTLSGISAQYNVPLDELNKLNGLTSRSIIGAGQEIVVKVETLTPVPPTPTAAPTQTPAATPTSPPPPTATPVQGGLCLGAFDDANNNTVRDGGEASLAGVTFVVLSGGSQAASYTTEGASQPNCLTQLSPGSYSVQIALPAGYVAALDKTDLTLVSGQRTDLIVAARRGEKAAPTLAATTPAQPKATAPARSNTGLIAGIIAVIAILLLGAVAVVVIQRRQ